MIRCFQPGVLFFRPAEAEGTVLGQLFVQAQLLCMRGIKIWVCRQKVSVIPRLETSQACFFQNTKENVTLHWLEGRRPAWMGVGSAQTA